MLSKKGLSEVDEVITRYPEKRAAILPLFHLFQQEHGYVSAEAEEWIGERLGLTPVKVHEVLTFYSMLHCDPVGKFHLQVCRTLSCELRGSEALLTHLRTKYGLANGGVGEDGLFSLDEVECLGACGTAPVVQVNDDYHVDLTVDSFEALLDELRNNDSSGADGKAERK